MQASQRLWARDLTRTKLGTVVPRNRTKFHQADIARAVRGATGGGLKIQRIEIDSSGKIVLVVDGAATSDKAALDSWLGRKHAHPA